MEGSLVAYKTFTNGSVLPASDVNDYLMRQSVIVFSSSVARASAITSPVEGMLTYLEDTNTYQFWNGSAWTNLVSSTAGLEHIITQTFTGVASVSLGSDASPVFSSTYDHYRILLNSGSSTSAARTFAIRMRANTTDDSSANYFSMNDGIDNGGAARNTTLGSQTSAVIVGFAGNSSVASASFDLFDPFKTDRTKALGINYGQNDGGQTTHQSFSSALLTATSYNGFTLLNSSGNFTNGSVSVYGYRKA
jgi:hypothetical protein